MEPVEIKIKGYEVIQSICRDGEFDHKPMTWDDKKVMIILLEPIEPDPANEEKEIDKK